MKTFLGLCGVVAVALTFASGKVKFSTVAECSVQDVPVSLVLVTNRDKSETVGICVEPGKQASAGKPPG
ncbi:MAG: hypothetical protein RBJ76_13640 [Stenomitos frigidus ULC029]